MQADTLVSGYIIAWCIYLTAATGLLIVFWRITKGLQKRRTRRILRAAVATLLLTPVNLAQHGVWLAPAYLVAAYDTIQGQTETAMIAAIMMSAMFSLLIVLMLVESAGRRILGLSTQY